jgi:hypothetical protein
MEKQTLSVSCHTWTEGETLRGPSPLRQRAKPIAVPALSEQSLSESFEEKTYDDSRKIQVASPLKSESFEKRAL